MTKPTPLSAPQTHRRFLVPHMLAGVLTLLFAAALVRWIQPEPSATPSEPDPERWQLALPEVPPPLVMKARKKPTEPRPLPKRPPPAGMPQATVAALPLAPVQTVRPALTAADDVLATTAYVTADQLSPSLPAAPELVPLSLSASSPEPPVQLLPIVAAPPLYPMEALRRGLSGWVLLAYRVTKEGRVADVRVLDAEPPSVFNPEAIAAARRWRYEPVVVNGEPVELPQVWSKLTFTMPTATEGPLNAQSD